MADTANEFRYRAFISYSHQDRAWARWLFRRLERYRTPKHILGQTGRFGPVSERLAPIFRDRDELASGTDLTTTIRDALAQSAALIVIASPASAQSRWVNQEIIEFIRIHGEGSVFVLIVAGEPKADGLAQCYAPALRYRINPDGELTDERVDLIAADARDIGDGRKRALLKLIAGLLGVDYDLLIRRENQRRYRRMAVITTFSIIGMGFSLTLATIAYMASQDAEQRRQQAENLLEFMVGDLRESLEPLGQLHVLEDVADQAMDYFSEVEDSDMTTLGLAQRARVLTHVGSIRLQQLQYDGAVDAFQEAYQRAADLVELDATDPQLLFQRGQAEYWVGFANWEQGNFSATRDWWQRYLATSEGLLAFAPTNPDWLREVGYGHHNMGALAVRTSDLVLARTSFERELALLKELEKQDSAPLQFGPDIADVQAWLGDIAILDGKRVEALDHYQQSRTLWEDLLAIAPNHAGLKFRVSSALMKEYTTALRTISADTKEHQLTQALALRKELSEADRDNKRHLKDFIKTELLVLELGMARQLENPNRLAELLSHAATLTRLHAQESGDWSTRQALIDTHRMIALEADSLGQQSQANESMVKGLALIDELSDEVAVAGVMPISIAHALLAFEQLGHHNAYQDNVGRTVTADQVIAFLTPLAGATKQHQLQELWVRALTRVGRTNEALALRNEITNAGYKPLHPWSGGLSTDT